MNLSEANSVDSLELNQEKINEELSRLAKAKGETVQIISKAIGKHYNTVNRILRNENKRLPDRDTIIKVCMYAFNASSFSEILKNLKRNNYVSLFNYISIKYDFTPHERRLFEVEDLHEFATLLNTSCSSGATITDIVSTVLKIEIEKISSKFGKEATPKGDQVDAMSSVIRTKVGQVIKNYKNEKLLKEIETGRFKLVFDSVRWSEATTRRFSSELVKLWEIEDPLSESMMRFAYESVSKEVFNKIMYKQREYYKDISKLVQEHGNSGNYKVLVMNMALNINPKTCMTSDFGGIQ